MKRLFKPLFLALALVFGGVTIATPAWAGKAPVYTAKKNNLAVSGYDAVSYFSGTPVKGSADYTYSHNGADWQFSSQANLDAFKANPDAFAPQYGGYCAWAAAKGKLAKGDAKQWKVVDGKLYLNYSAGVKRKWEKDIPGFIEKADDNWPSLLDK